MIYKIKKENNSYLEKEFKKCLKELNDFYKINWIKNLPRLFLIESRKTIDSLKNKKTKSWVRGWSEGRNIFLLDNEFMEKESSHKKASKEEYFSLIKHELSHSFFRAISNGFNKPIWLNEGLSVYLSGQIKFYNRINKFNNFLDFYNQSGGNVYQESGFAVKILIEQFGKEKILKLIKKLEDFSTKEKFNILFKEIYKSNLNYAFFNKYLDKIK